jgi:hypothetical protein
MISILAASDICTECDAIQTAFMAGSTYSGTFENSVEINNGQGWMEEKHRKLLGAQPKKFGTKWREVVYQRQAPNSFYQTDFGVFGDGMAAKLPKDPLGFSKAASTADLFHGSNKVSEFSSVFAKRTRFADDSHNSDVCE